MSIAEEAAQLNWYHTMELPGGVVTPGYFDTRGALASIPFPADLTGKRCLDVGTCDGFWAFEMERRGAASVVGIDVDDPSQRDYPAFHPPTPDSGRAHATFSLAKTAFDSKVERVPMTVYELSPERLGHFDFAFVGAILLHLRDPVKALTAVRTVTDELLVADVVWLAGTRLFPKRPVAMLTGQGTSRWWTVNMAGLERLCVAAGFEVVAKGGPFYVPFGEGIPKRTRRKGAPLTSRISSRFVDRFGAPHGWMACRARQR